ncbi:MAG: bifunctional proline dehydrogenase/L-glutamate gamma-semialdehyde dehydrogenase PutA [Devosia sp.]
MAEDAQGEARTSRPFAAFDPTPRDRGPLRRCITEACRLPEPECVPPLIEQASLPADAAGRVRATATRLVEAIRAKGHARGVEGLIHEYSLSSEEGVALMCLAEALLRIPDSATRDALIRDKVSRGNWRAHLGPERSLFVNAATWGLMVTGRLTSAIPEDGLANALTRLIARGGEPVIRTGVDLAMRMMGEQFVTGQTIGEALDNSRRMQARGFQYSYDMLGEAATTAADADRYYAAYRDAIVAIGRASAGRGPYGGPGISIKLSALHPRYRRSQIDRVMGEVLPRLRELALLAKASNIGLNIDAEESDRLEISLDLLEALCLDPALAGWNGIGFVVQAYSKRCPFVVDFLIDLSRRSGHRIMVRLVKGAYWDSEIKQAQVEGLGGYPVYTRKVYSDVSYLACARKLLFARGTIFPQFATHNAQTVAAIYEMAGPHFTHGDYEFQCLHGMGERLYAEVVGPEKLHRPCRIYAPVGTHGTLLAYLVRRLLENGANSSFVNRIGDEAIPIDELVADPVDVARRIDPLGAPHPHIALPSAILGTRRNSAGLDLTNDIELDRLEAALSASVDRNWDAGPVLADGAASGVRQEVRNPSNHADLVGVAYFATPDLVARAFAASTSDWAPRTERAQYLRRAACALESGMCGFMGLIIREAGKSAANAVSEVREAVDFLRYYADEAEGLADDAKPLGTMVCISPWNFPLAIFTGQVAAALAAGNAVIAKPAEETPLIASQMVRLLHAAGVPESALQLLPGAGDIGAALVGHPDVAGVAFTGSYEVAKLIQKRLAQTGTRDGRPIPLIAETGGQNAMIVDSSALTEQVVGDVLSSAFDSAGQRCSALRVLCLQDDIAERTLEMLEGAMAEMRIGNPGRLCTDIGPVISADARDRIAAHVNSMRAKGHRVVQAKLSDSLGLGTFLAPTLIELDHIEELTREVFGPVLHIVRYSRGDLLSLVDRINALGFGLTFGLHTRLDETVRLVTDRISAGNIYVNRNIIGAVVGVQPFGGYGFSGTGPKAGGPHYVRRLTRGSSGPSSAVAKTVLLQGPTGEENYYRTVPRGDLLLLAETATGLRAQLAIVFATGNLAVLPRESPFAADVETWLDASAGRYRVSPDWHRERLLGGILVEGDDDRVAAVCRTVANFDGPIVTVQAAGAAGSYDADLLRREVAVSVNTSAAGGNASLMAMRD